MTERRDGSARLSDGRRLSYAEWGDPAGRPVLLLHGSPGSRLFHPDADATATAGVRLITYDRPGCGGSDRREGRELLDTPADVAQLADHLGLDRFALVGVSAGGAHALACAHVLGERLAAVGVASMPGPLDEVPGAWDALPTHVRPAAEMARREPARAIRGVVRYMGPVVAEPATFLRGGPPADRAVIADRGSGEMLLGDVAEALRPGAEGFADDMVTLWLPWGFPLAGLPEGIRVWHGAQDTRAEPDFEHLAATLPGPVPAVWPDGGHYGVLRHWAELLGALETY
ncbi:MAG: alpha/beta fold hydrolase [Actinomycetota bacterium]